MSATRLLYSYVGPPEIARRVSDSAGGTVVASADDVQSWIRRTNQTLDARGQVTATFVVDEAGRLRIADRRSEHVACAGGRAVRSAGEFTFAVASKEVLVVWTSNQSTGYCPEAASWPSVAGAMQQAGLVAGERFDRECVFRRCRNCRSINIVKDELFECAVCRATLPPEWNFDETSVGVPKS